VRFSAAQIAAVRKQHPGIRVIVHPEVPWDVVQAADESGSTEYIIKAVKNSPAGSVWAVGTEVHLVNRLAQEVAPGRTVVSLDQFGCLCSTMFRVSPNHLLWILEELVEGRVHNRIVVSDEQKHWQFWQWMAPNAGGAPTGKAADAINSSFGSFDNVRTEWSKAGVGRFGSGWVWLLKDGGKRSIVSTLNQDNPLMDGKTPILG